MNCSGMQSGSQQLASPELVMQVLQASQDLVITPQEFSEIMGTVTNIAAGIMTVGILGWLFGTLTSSILRPQWVHTEKKGRLEMLGRYDGYKPQWEGFINLTSGDILETSCGHGTRVGPDRVYLIIHIDGSFSCYCKECERKVIALR